jgi:hypothetical protein
MLSSAACKRTDKFDAVVLEMDAFAARLCGCPDVACADKVSKDVLDFRKTLKDRLGNARPTDAQTKRGREAENKLNECRSKLSTTGFEPVLTQLEAFKTRMCACADKACTDKVADEWQTYRASVEDNLGADANPDPDQDKRGRLLDVEMKTCRERFDAAPAPRL